MANPFDPRRGTDRLQRYTFRVTRLPWHALQLSGHDFLLTCRHTEGVREMMGRRFQSRGTLKHRSKSLPPDEQREEKKWRTL
jgi:hypothetical protein